jgi:hypothetical protein
MSRKFWFLVSILAIASFAIVACQPAAAETAVEAAPEEQQRQSKKQLPQKRLHP